MFCFLLIFYYIPLLPSCPSAFNEYRRRIVAMNPTALEIAICNVNVTQYGFYMTIQSFLNDFDI